MYLHIFYIVVFLELRAELFFWTINAIKTILVIALYMEVHIQCILVVQDWIILKQ